MPRPAMSIWTEVLGFIQRPDPACFEPLALRVFRHQFDSVAPYREYCVERGLRPETVRSIADVPAVSTIAFKHAQLATGAADRVFMTSGTTVGPLERGRHFIPHLEIYRASAVSHLRRMLFPDRIRPRMLTLHPTADRMPESSLAQMISWCVEEFGNGCVLCAASRDRVAIGDARDFLLDSAGANEPVCILGTTAAFAALFSSLIESNTAIRLHPASRIMDTGGAKGQATPLSSGDLISAAERWLGIDAPRLINEYGMTEMCSQLYDSTAFNWRDGEPARRTDGPRRKIGPPWLRVAAVDPAAMKPVAPGAPGLLWFFDLANVGSVSALVTEDFGIVDGNEVFVLGRAVADARGCALGIAEFAALSAPRSKFRSSLGLEHEAQPAGHLERGASAHGAANRQALNPESLALVGQQLRASLRAPIETDRIARALQETFLAWQDRSFAPRRQTLSEAATAWGCSVEMLDESLDAMLCPFSAAAIRSLAARLEPRRQVFGFIMPGNVLGAGLHEVCQAMLAGAAIIVKPASKEPRFFAAFAGTVDKIDAEVGSRIRVLNWGRDRAELTTALNEACETVVAFGSDETLSKLAADARVIGFGSRASGALIASDCDLKAVADAVARDICLFEQQGCLSPHHVMVEDRTGAVARGFAQSLARSLDDLRCRIPPPTRLALNDAAAIRSARENARWRRIGGGDVEMWEGADFGWTVVYEHAASFRLSPGHRAVYVTPIRDLGDFKTRLAPVAGRLEAFAVADPAGRLGDFGSHLSAIGVSYVCAPGQMQSPPIDWRHGSGVFLDLFLSP